MTTLPAGWTEVALGDLAQFINGAAFKESDWGDSGHRIIRIQNLTDPGKPYNRTERRVKDDLYVKPGDLLVSWSATLGVFQWAGPDVAVLNQHIFRVVPKHPALDGQYLGYLLRSAIRSMVRHTHGATMKHINRGEFLGTTVPLPPPEQQRRIAAILDKADELRAKRRCAVEQLDRLTQSIFTDMFGDPRSANRSWNEEPLADLVRAPITRGIDQPGPDDPTGVPYIKTSDFAARSVRRDQLARAAVEVASRFPRSVVEDGDLVMCIRATVGPIMQVDQELAGANLSRGTARIAPGERVMPAYLREALRSRAIQSRIAGKLRGATFLQIPLAEVKQLPIPTPPMAQQRLFAERVGKVEPAQRFASRSAISLDDLFASLQSRAFRGEL